MVGMSLSDTLAGSVPDHRRPEQTAGLDELQVASSDEAARRSIAPCSTAQTT